MSTEANPTPAENPGESSAIKQMRERIDAQNAELKAEKERANALQAQIQEAERAKLEENERLKLELQDRDKRIQELSPFQEKYQSFETQAQADYDAELTKVPEDKRGILQTATANGSAIERLSLLRQLTPHVVTAPPVVRTGGQPTPVNPTVGEPQPVPFDPKNPYNGAWKS